MCYKPIWTVMLKRDVLANILETTLEAFVWFPDHMRVVSVTNAGRCRKTPS